MIFWRRFIKGTIGASWTRSGLADEAEAFLRGRALEELLAGGSCWRPPSWVWLNTVAHGSAQQLRDIAEPASRPVVQWSAARAALADELLTRTGGDPHAIARVQRDALEPLEQSLDSLPGLTPGEFVDMALQAMGQCDA